MSSALATAFEEDVSNIPLKKIKTVGATQPRDTLNHDVIADYAEEMLNGANFPPITLYYDGSHYWPSDGFHRINAALRAKLETIRAKVIQGTRRDAIFASFGANADHGLRRSNADKRRAVARILEDDEWTRMSDSSIGRHCRVSPAMIGAMRLKLGIVGPSMKTYTRNGKTQVMNTVNHRGRKPTVMESPNFSKPPAELAVKTLPTLYESFLSKVRGRGVEAKTHVPTPFGTIDIETPDAVYIIAGAMTPRVFREAFVTLLFQRSGKQDAKRAVIVGTPDETMGPWVKEAKRHGVELLDFKI